MVDFDGIDRVSVHEVPAVCAGDPTQYPEEKTVIVNEAKVYANSAAAKDHPSFTCVRAVRRALCVNVGFFHCKTHQCTAVRLRAWNARCAKFHGNGQQKVTLQMCQEAFLNIFEALKQFFPKKDLPVNDPNL